MWRMLERFNVGSEKKAKCMVAPCRTILILSDSNTSYSIKYARAQHDTQYVLVTVGRTLAVAMEAIWSQNIREMKTSGVSHRSFLVMRGVAEQFVHRESSNLSW